MNTRDDAAASGCPEDLTPEELVRYRALARETDPLEVEAKVRELLAHPEQWVASEQILRDVGAILSKATEKPHGS